LGEAENAIPRLVRCDGIADACAHAGAPVPYGARPMNPSESSPQPDPAALDRAVDAVARRCLAVRPGEELLVIGDDGTAELARRLRDAAAAAGAEAVLALMSPRETHGSNPPPSVAQALAACSAFVAATTYSLSHTPARKLATERGARGASMPGITAATLARVLGGADLDAVARRSRAVGERLEAASEARITCPLGSDLTLDLRGAPGIPDDGDLSQPGAFGNLPFGEAYCVPRGGEGRLVASSLASVGIPDAPVALEVRDGALHDGEGDVGRAFAERLRAVDARATNVAELGVGTNDAATLTGSILEDEKMLGSVHVAFGASAAIGGTVDVPVHLDVVVLDASLELDGELLLDRGRLLVD